MFEKFKKLGKSFKKEADFYRLVSADPRTPKHSKWLLIFAVSYAISPIDLIPDFVPVLGLFDDAIVLPILITIALRLIPKEVMEENRKY